MEWNYYSTFITVSEDCPARAGTVPPEKKTGKTKPRIEYELIAENPYRYTQKEILFEVYLRHKGISPEEAKKQGALLREAFYARPKPCMRVSMLPKKYGWGIHFDENGKMALVPVESSAYREFLEGKRGDVRVLAGMRNRRKGSE